MLFKKANYRKTKRILLVSGGLYFPNICFSGVGAILALYREIVSSKTELEFHVLTSAPSALKSSCRQWATKERKEHGLHFHYVFFNGFRNLAALNLVLTRIYLFLAAIKLQVKFRFKIINDFSSSPWLFFDSLIFHFLGAKTIHTFCTTSNYNFLNSKILWKLGRLTDGLVVTSSLVEEKLISFGLAPSKVKYISFGVNTEKFLPQNKTSFLPRVVFVGSNPVRGGKFFFEVAEKISKAKFVWVTNKIFQSPKNVKTITGIVDIAKIFNKSDIAVFPYQKLEGIFFEPQTLLEAMSSGLAIVMTDFPILKATAGPKNALFFPENDFRFFTELIKKLLNNRELRSKLGGRARKEALAKYDIKKSVAKTIKYYKFLLRSEKTK